MVMVICYYAYSFIYLSLAFFYQPPSYKSLPYIFQPCFQISIKSSYLSYIVKGKTFIQFGG